MRKYLLLPVLVASLLFSQGLAAGSLEEKIETIKGNIWNYGPEYKARVLLKLSRMKEANRGIPERMRILERVEAAVRGLNLRYGITKAAAPILTTKEFRKYFYGTGSGPMLDEYEQIDPVATVIGSGGTIIIEEESKDIDGTPIYKIHTREYPSDEPIYIDSRFVRETDEFRPYQKKLLPTEETILNSLVSQVGSEYIWGGTLPGGVPEMLEYYRPNRTLEEKRLNRLTLKGFDCSGLLQYATQGHTPRNTSELVTFGSGLDIKDKDIEEILQLLQPLDLITWKGHVMIILDSERLIESRLDYDTEKPGFEGGVRIREIRPVLEDLLKSKIGVDDYSDAVPEGKKKFVVRRWYPEN